MKAHVVIPARGGSKRFVGKNTAFLGGKPLLAWVIEAAQRSSYIDNIYVSTDSDKVADIGRRCGADIIDRPAELCTDMSTAEEALLHSLQVMEEEGTKPDILVMLQCTSPFTTSEDIDDSVETIAEYGYSCCFTAVRFTGFIWEQVNKEAVPVNHPRYIRKRTQDIQTQYIETGSVYAMEVAAFEKEKYRFCGRSVGIIQQRPEQNHDINNEYDLRVAEAMLKGFPYVG